MNNCILCHSNLVLHYGDDIYGEIFCKECYDKYSCFHCHRMNMNILFDSNDNLIDVLIKPLCGTSFNLYCKECWENEQENIYEDNEDNLSVDPYYNPADDDSYESDNYEDYDEEDDYNNQDTYHIGKGRYDLY